MYTLNDFSIIFCTSKRTIARRIIKITPILKIVNQKQRKHFYTENEANMIIKCIGIPPNNEYNRQLKDERPNLFV
jgi:hypothetical protein